MGLFGRLFGRDQAPAKKKYSATVNIGQAKASWKPKNYAQFAKETYLKNVIAFRCIQFTSASISSIPWHLWKKTSDDQRVMIENHPINEILRQPNPEESFSYLTYKHTAFMLLNGNSFWERLTPDSGPNKNTPKELYVLRPDKMTKILVDDQNHVIGYVYNNGTPVMVDPVTGKSDILHIKLFHPLDDIWGASITEPTAREIDSSNEATEWQKKMFENEGRPGMLLTVEGELEETQFDRLEQQLKDGYSGSHNAGKNLILENGGKITATPYNWNPKEMDWIDSNRELARRVCLGYGVPPQLMGIPGDSTYSNYKEARQAFWEETVLFYANQLREELNTWAFEEGEDLFLDYDLSKIPAFAEKQNQLWKRAEEANFLTTNEKRELVGYDSISGGDVILVPATMIPIDAAGTEATTEDDAKALQEMRRMVNEGYSEDEAKRLLGLR